VREEESFFFSGFSLNDNLHVNRVEDWGICQSNYNLEEKNGRGSVDDSVH